MKTVLYTCPYIPAELIAAHDLRPCRITPSVSDSDTVLLRAEGLCPYVQTFINEILTGKNACGIIVTTLCDQMRRAIDIIEQNSEIPVFLLNVPKTWQTVTVQKLYFDELSRMSRFLVGLGGISPSNDNLTEIMLKFDAMRKIILTQREYLSARRYAELITEFNIYGLDTQLDKIEQNSPITSGTPLAVIGGPLLKNDFDILDIVEQVGGRIVFNATENAERGFCECFDRRALSSNPLMELANAYFNGIKDASRRPNSELYHWLGYELKIRDIRGIIFHRNLWCDIWHVELQRLRDWSGLPILNTVSTGNSGADRQRLQNRIQAFMEIVR